jgi:hypothetical protein
MDNCLRPFDNLKCPFCPNHNLRAKPGKTTCPECQAEFEIDDRLECTFINPNKLKLPVAVNGAVYGECGLVQGDEVGRCGYCGEELEMTVH